jgi:TM2 domain-containing membrane protein YozV
MDDFINKPVNKLRPKVHQPELTPHRDINVNVHNTTPVIKTGVLERNWLTALLLSIFLGGLGIDQFYLGKTGKGILKLFTGGLLGVLWIIDIIMIATKSVNNIVWKEATPKSIQHTKTVPIVAAAAAVPIVASQGAALAESVLEKSKSPVKSSNWFANHKIATSAIAIVALIFIVVVATNTSKPTTPKPLAVVSTATKAATTKPTTTTTTTTAKTATAKPANTAPTRKVTGTVTTLGAGNFNGGTDVAVGLYNVTTLSGQSGNFIVTGTDNYDEILGVSDGQGVPEVRAQISKGDQIQISSLSSVTFTPVTTPYVTTHSTLNLYAGTFIVGQDIGAGRYVATTSAGSSGNFIVTGTDNVDEILGVSGGQGVPSVSTNLTNSDVIQISGLSQVTLTATN